MGVLRRYGRNALNKLKQSARAVALQRGELTWVFQPVNAAKKHPLWVPFFVVELMGVEPMTS